jgi:hypothetical protein
MKFTTWLAHLKTPSHNRRARRAHRGNPTRRPTAESLEDRTVPTFAAPVPYDVGPSPQAIVTGNFTDDNIPDLAIANYGDGTVSVLPGTGTGTFGAAITSPAGAAPISLAVGDFNDDGFMDLGVANPYEVTILMGNGNGTFAAPNGIALGTNPVAVAVGDFNNDTIPDLAATSDVYDPWNYSYYGVATVMLGNGNGTFAAPVSSFAGYGFHEGAAAADFNGDGFDDFAAANYDYWSVTAVYSDGLGNLVGPSDYGVGAYPTAVVTGDVNGDLQPDLVTADSGSGEVSVWLGDAGGGFTSGRTFTAGDQPVAVALGNFDQDTHVDIVTANSYGNDVTVLRGRGNGYFVPADHAPAGAGASGVAAADFNGDGWPDVATADNGGGTASVLINDQSWPPPPPPTISVNDVWVTEGNTGTTDATFTVSLTYPADDNVTVHWTTADGSATAPDDYVGDSGDVTIPAGQTSWPVTVKVNGDRVGEPTETFGLNLSAPVNATAGDMNGIGTIIDDEPRVSVGDSTVTEGDTGSVTATFTVYLSATSDVPVTVHWATDNGTAEAGKDYVAAADNVTIPAGSPSATFTVAVTGDQLGEPTENYVVNLTAPVNAGIGDSQGVGTILDNEPRIRINNVAKKEGNGNTTKFDFTVTLSAAYNQAVTVHYDTANGTALAGSDYQAKSGTVTIPAGTTSAKFTILVNGDKAKEPDETFFVNLSAPSSYAVIDDPQGIGTILDDDTHPH